MNPELEQTLIKKFVNNDKQERYLGFLSKEKSRSKFTNELHHFKDFNWNLFSEIPGNQNERDVIKSKLARHKNISGCYVISSHTSYDGALYTVDEAINNIVGEQEVILIFGNADVVYYEGEAPDNRYISI